MNKKAITFLILFVISFFASLFLHLNKINVPYFNGIYKKVQLDVNFEKTPPEIYFNNKKINTYTKIDNNHFLFEDKAFNNIKTITLNETKNIKQLLIYNDNNLEKIEKIEKEIKINNEKTFLDKSCVSFLSFFYNPQYYIISYIFLFLFLYNFQFKTNYKIKKYVLLLLLLSIILRICQINSIPFWDDEVYILVHSATNAKLIELFNDPGNPPLYFILFKIYNSIIRNEDFYKYSSILIGVLFNISFYYYLKTFLKKKRALIGLFIVSINITLIYFSQEIRCYMLMMLLATIDSILLFKFKNKTKFLYLITTFLMLYTHFYCAFYVLYNFIFGINLFYKNKKKLKSFILINILAFISYLPLLIYKKNSITSDFNSWIKFPDLMDIYLTILTIFGGIIVMAIFIIFLSALYKKQNKKIKIFINYNFYIIPFVIIFAIIVSYLIKPIYCYRYFYIVFPSYLALITFIISYNFKSRFKPIIAIILLLLFTINLRLNKQNLFCNHNLYIDFVKKDIDITKTNYVFMTDTVENYNKFKIENANTIYIRVNKGIEEFDYKNYNIKPNSIIYVPNLYLKNDTYKTAKKIDLYKTPLGIFCKIIL